MSRKGLGKGLGALIVERDNTNGEIKEILIKDLVPNPDQPRKEFDQEKLQELADSIREHGLIQPVLVKPHEGKYCIIAGERRFRASQLLGLDRISCIVRECSDQDMTEKALIENIQRTDLSPVEEGLAYARLMNEYGLTQEQVAKKVGKGRPTVANLLRIIQLPGEVLQLLSSGTISLGHAKVLLGVEDSSMQVDLAKKIVEEALSVRQLEATVLGETLISEEQEINNEASSSKTSRKKSRTILKHSDLNDIQDKLHGVFQTKVKILGNEKRGKIEIEYYSKDELDRLLEIWHIDAN